MMPAVEVILILMLAKKKIFHVACHTCLAALLTCVQPADVPVLSALHDAWLCKIRQFFSCEFALSPWELVNVIKKTVW